MPNRLSEELSPYLLQHQNNPVDWYPWNEEAFLKAREENKPIFLSIGYATCHWCHVMEHESFEDREVAALLNEVFVAVKVDREERPDIDQVYMTYCQLSTGHGGWPLTIIMTPDKEPFFAGTYLPKQSRHGRVGMMDLIPRVQGIWESRHQEVLDSARQNTEILNKASEWVVDTSVPGKAVLDHAYRQLSENFDDQHGGFGTAPKFPSPHQLLFLIDYHQATGEGSALEMVKMTLQKMRLGGIFDHIGFGFHRYSTDAQWLLPHFEKMLYDQAMIALAAIETYNVTQEHIYREIADRIFDYVYRDMTAPEGAFYSAEDADSERVEGKFYVWLESEIEELLSADEVNLVKKHYNFEQRGNFVDEASHVRTGANIPHLATSLFELDQKTQQALENARQTLFNTRKQRIHPLKDDKILTDWNGLLIAALARYVQVVGNEDKHLEKAKAAVRFIRETLYKDEQGLFHRYRKGVSGIRGHLDDYAFLVWGLIELYRVEYDVEHLAWAVELTDLMLEKFWDDEKGGFYFASSDGELLIARTKEAYDGAIPSGNSIALMNLLRLSRMTGNTKYDEKADQMLKMFGAPMRRQPSGFTAMLLGLRFVQNKSYEIVVVGEKEDSDTQRLLEVINEASIHQAALLVRDESSKDALDQIAPFTVEMQALNDRATVYVCQDFQCNLPVNDPEELAALLKKD